MVAVQNILSVIELVAVAVKQYEDTHEISGVLLKIEEILGLVSQMKEKA